MWDNEVKQYRASGAVHTATTVVSVLSDTVPRKNSKN